MLPFMFFVAAALDAAGHEAGPGQDGSEIVSLSIDPSSCNREQATNIALTTLARDYRRRVGECVAVQGWWRGHALFRSPADAARPGALWNPQWSRERIGLYGEARILRGAPDEPRRVTAVGLVSACERFRGGIHGYCHSLHQGGFLILGELHPHRR